MTKFYAIALFVSSFLLFPSHTYAASWYYPMTKIEGRATLKGFGTLANEVFYKAHDAALFPTHFYGYHAAADLESLKNEKQDSSLVPFYAVSDGTITYLGSLSGYGGVILEKLSDEQHTALYGHVKLPSDLHVGDSVAAGQLISFLGNNFSTETSGERKHLHFAIHNGTDLYFHGHEANTIILNSEWEDPIPFLKDRGAKTPGEKLGETLKSSTKPEDLSLANKNFFQAFLSFLSSLFHKP